MNTLLISYDLKGHETSEDYKKVISYIESHGVWAKPLYSVYLIRTSKSCSTVRDEIQQKVDSNDRVLVLNVTGDNWATYNIPKEVTDWMHNNI